MLLLSSCLASTHCERKPHGDYQSIVASLSESWFSNVPSSPTEASTFPCEPCLRMLKTLRISIFVFMMAPLTVSLRLWLPFHAH